MCTSTPFAELIEISGEQEEQPVDFDPFVELVDFDNEHDDQHDVSNAGNLQRPIISKSAKRLISSAKLAKVKDQADQTWQQHIATSVRMPQWPGTVPTVLEDKVAEQPHRFPVHYTDSPVAIRSIVACKQCGYLGIYEDAKVARDLPWST